MKKIKFVFVCIFVLLLVLPILAFNNEPHMISTIDNTYLADLDVRIFDSSFTSNLDNYISGRIGYREEALYAYDNFHYDVLKEASVKDIHLGKENEIYTDFNGIINYDEYLEDFAIAISKMSTYCKERGKPFYFMLNTEKQALYPEYIPDYVEYSNQYTRDFVARLRELGVTVIDCYEILSNYVGEERLYNKSFDVVHWNDYGAFYGINGLLEEMSKDFENVKPNNINDFEISEETYKYYNNSVLEINDTVPIIKKDIPVKNVSEYESGSVEFVAPFITFNHSYNLEKSKDDYPSVLGFSSSFLISEDRYKYILNQSSEYVLVHTYQNIFNLPYYVNLYNPDCVVYELAQFTLSDYYFSQWRMNSFDPQPSLDEEGYENIYVDGLLYSETRKYLHFETTLVNPSEYDFDKVYIKYDERVFDLTWCGQSWGTKDHWVITEPGTIPTGSIIEVVFTNSDTKTNYHYDAYVY